VTAIAKLRAFAAWVSSNDSVSLVSRRLRADQTMIARPARVTMIRAIVKSVHSASQTVGASVSVVSAGADRLVRTVGY
jgi:hypothetical protein